MILYSPDNSALMEVLSIERDGNELVIRGKVFGTMPITARLKPDQARRGLKLLRPRTAFFLLSMLFRRSKNAAS